MHAAPAHIPLNGVITQQDLPLSVCPAFFLILLTCLITWAALL